MQTLKVPFLKKPYRVDLFLKDQFSHFSRRSVQKMIAENLKVNGRKSRKGQMLQGGELLEWDESLLTRSYSEDSQLKLKIVLEDEDFLVIEKPSGIPVHPLKNTEKGTLIQGVFAQFPETQKAGPNPREGGLIHRLDNETSGLLLVARNPFAYSFFRDQFRKHQVDKEYLALVRADPCLLAYKSQRLKIEKKIGHDPKNKKRMKVMDSGRIALTEIHLEEIFKKHALLRINILTGVRHQIRVHLASIGFPLVGDSLYKGEPFTDSSSFLLHATRLKFLHPRSLKEVNVKSPLPTRFRNQCC